MSKTRISKNSVKIRKKIFIRKKKNNDPRLHFKKLQKGRIKKLEFSKKRLQLIFGNAALRALAAGRIFAPQLETLRRILFKKANRHLRFWNRSSLVYYLTAKSISIRMGRGKGNLVNVVARISGGAIVVEFSGLLETSLKEIENNLINKLYMPSEIIQRTQYL